ncbi:hypothetical protein ABKN59_001254 [Abortiporus biennis]
MLHWTHMDLNRHSAAHLPHLPQQCFVSWNSSNHQFVRKLSLHIEMEPEGRPTLPCDNNTSCKTDVITQPGTPASTSEVKDCACDATNQSPLPTSPSVLPPASPEPSLNFSNILAQYIPRGRAGKPATTKPPPPPPSEPEK